MKLKLNSTDQITSNQIKADISCQKNELNLILIWKKNCNKMLKGHSCFDLIFLTFAVLDWFSILLKDQLEKSLFEWHNTPFFRPALLTSNHFEVGYFIICLYCNLKHIIMPYDMYVIAQLAVIELYCVVRK